MLDEPSAALHQRCCKLVSDQVTVRAGSTSRRKLQLRPVRASSGYVIPPEELPRSTGSMSATESLREPVKLGRPPRMRSRTSHERSVRCVCCPERLHPADPGKSMSEKARKSSDSSPTCPLPTFTTFIRKHPCAAVARTLLAEAVGLTALWAPRDRETRNRPPRRRRKEAQTKPGSNRARTGRLVYTWSPNQDSKWKFRLI